MPTLIAAAGERASLRFLEFFAANIRNPHTRRAYVRAVSGFLAWCDEHGVSRITAVQPLHVAVWIETQTRTHAAPTVKQQLAALRHLFDWLVTGQVVPVNPAGSVRGPSHAVKAGKTPVLEPAEARLLLESIDVSKPVGLRDRALIALMVYSFAHLRDCKLLLPDPTTRHARLHSLRTGSERCCSRKHPNYQASEQQRDGCSPVHHADVPVSHVFDLFGIRGSAERQQLLLRHAGPGHDKRPMN